MKEELAKILCCPKCRRDLELRDFEGDGEEISEGLFVCSGCAALHPIVRRRIRTRSRSAEGILAAFLNNV